MANLHYLAQLEHALAHSSRYLKARLRANEPPEKHWLMAISALLIDASHDVFEARQELEAFMFESLGRDRDDGWDSVPDVPGDPEDDD